MERVASMINNQTQPDEPEPISIRGLIIDASVINQVTLGVGIGVFVALVIRFFVG